MANKKSNIFINTLVLVLVSAIAVASLAFVNQLTLKPIAEAEAAKNAGQYEAIYPNSKGSVEIDGLDKMIKDSEKLLADSGFDGCKIVEVIGMAGDNGDAEGYIIQASSPNGRNGEIVIAVGIKDGALTGFAPISHKEDAGYGQQCEEDAFKSQFAGKKAQVLTFTKDGAKSDTEIDAISGSTISTKAILEAVNSAILFYQENFGGGAQKVEGPDYTEFFKQAYPDATDFADVENADKMLADAPALLAEYGLDTAAILDVKSVNNGEGYVFVATGSGFQESTITLCFGIKGDKVTGFSVIESVETPAYGGQYFEGEYLNQFNGKSVGIKSPAVGSKADENVDAISGATYTVNGITNAFNATVVFYANNLSNGTITVSPDEMPDLVASATA